MSFAKGICIRFSKNLKEVQALETKNVQYSWKCYYYRLQTAAYFAVCYFFDRSKQS